eukprot:m.28758 g.28758  ORF g.28758 m.28758 type:complete len:54 (-) comp9074_c0_seq3:49-210(-)
MQSNIYPSCIMTVCVLSCFVLLIFIHVRLLGSSFSQAQQLCLHCSLRLLVFSI